MLPLIALASIANQSRYIDTDRDGLLDYWETEGFGPIKPSEHGCSPTRPDVFIVFRIRSTDDPSEDSAHHRPSQEVLC